MKKRVFIIHGWGGNPGELIHKLLKKRFLEKGFEVVIPEMPNTNEPIIEEWIPFLNKIVKAPDENTFFIGHSIGCQTIMRYIETLSLKTKIGGCMFIAGWFNLDNMESKEEERIAEPWIKTPINFNKIRKIVKNILVYISSNEPYGFIEENTVTFKDKLGAKVIIEKNIGHFTEEEGIDRLSKFINKIE